MKSYPGIPGATEAPIGTHCTVQKKYDGSNIKAEWNPKQGWYKFATRNQMIDNQHPQFKEAVTLFLAKYGEPLAKAIVDFKDFKKPIGAIAFVEFFGPHSFAGWHDPVELNKLPGIKIENNNPKDVILFDVNILKRGMVGPANFIKAFGHLHTPDILHHGILTEEFVEDVRQGKIVDGEGVVCKWGDGFNHNLGMCKIKTNQYIQLLKDRFGVGWQKYGE